MKFFRVIFVVGLLVLGVRWWNQRAEETAIRKARDQYGFMPVPMPSGAQQNTVLIFAPLNCPKEGAQRAIALSEKLTAAGVPNIRTSHYGAQAFEPTDALLAAFKRLDVVMTGEIPIALINGMGKSNPTADEVISEYNETRQ
jgi:hypothetical protein